MENQSILISACFIGIFFYNFIKKFAISVLRPPELVFNARISKIQNLQTNDE